MFQEKLQTMITQFLGAEWGGGVGGVKEVYYGI